MTQAAAAVQTRLPGTVLGMVLFITSEVMFFGALFGAYFTIRADASSWPPPGTPEIGPLPTGLITIALVASSFTQHAGVVALRRGDRARMLRWTALTIVLGVIFLVGQGLEYRGLVDEGFTLESGVFAGLFYSMTGFHGLHVTGGLLMLAIVLAKARAGHFTPEHHGGAEAAGLYWHFVDVVWILLFTVLYVVQ